MKKKFLEVVGLLAVMVAGATFFIYWFSRRCRGNGEGGRLIFIDRDNMADSVKAKSEQGWLACR